MRKPAEEIIASDIRIERLNKNHDLHSFKSYELELVKFLFEDALDNQEKRVSVTYLWFYCGNLVGYITMLTDRIHLEGNIKCYFRGKGINYKALPALKIGRLCVDDHFLRMGIGKLMISFAVNKADQLYGEIAGCRFITIDAKRNTDRSKDAIHFYKKLGFVILKERQKGTTPMYFDVSRP